MSLPDLTGRVAVVTGANAGLGLATTRALAEAGAHVVMACRDLAKADAAAAGLRAVGVPADRLSVERLDLADLAGVAAFAGRYPLPRLDLLVNNAGLMAVGPATTVDGFEMQFGVNHLGHMALTLALLPRLTATAGARVVTVSSMGHWAGRRIRRDDALLRPSYGRWRQYFQSKLANLLFTRELGRRLAAAGHDTLATAAHPGYSRTELGKDERRLVAGGIAVLDRFAAQSAGSGARPTLRAATDPAARAGAFFGPRWHSAGAAVPAPSSRLSRDPAQADALWRLSLDLLGATDPLRAPAG